MVSDLDPRKVLGVTKVARPELVGAFQEIPGIDVPGPPAHAREHGLEVPQANGALSGQRAACGL
eukprot:14148129-Alexandrium_andersonii.AAC.1